MKPLVDRPHRRLQHAVDPVLHVHRVVLRFDVDVAGAPLHCGVERGVHEANDRAGIRRQFLDRKLFVSAFVLAQDLELKTLGRVLEHAL